MKPATGELRRYDLVALPGDGIGPEVVAAARDVVDAAGRVQGFAVRWQERLVGGAAIEAYGTALRDEDLAACAAADAVLLGAVGGPRWDDPDAAVRPEQALFALRGGLGLYANLRPVRPDAALVDASPLRAERLKGADLLIVRELTGGIYFGRPSEERLTPEGREAVDTLRYTEAEIRRVVRLAFELARGRRGHLTSVDKANVLASSRLWRKVVDALRPEFPEVTVEHRLVDAAAMLLIQRPAAFDVLVTENLFGDILSDEAAVLTGSLGMLPSASLGERRTAHGRFGLYEPIHGSAPDIAGQGTANPIGTIRSAAMLLRWSLGEIGAAESIEAAIGAALDAGHGTPDVGRDDGTAALTAAIVAGLPVAVPPLGAASGAPA
ncbi:MAG: 3-isopropylmalate dehydrogenase [Candidatus Limnocylindrales bacterium]